MAKFYWDIEQGTAEWYRLRSTIPTASNFDKIITPARLKLSESRHKYACTLIAARLLNWQADSLEKIEHIQHGREYEPMAVAQLELVQEIETRAVGFVTSGDGRFGASPDRVSQVSADLSAVGITVECKCPTVPKQFEYLLLGHDNAYRCQVQGQMLIAESDKSIFYAYHPRTPAFLVETGRDEMFIRELRAALEQFSDELECMFEAAKRLGLYQAFAEIVTPAEATYADQLAQGADAVETELSR